MRPDEVEVSPVSAIAVSPVVSIGYRSDQADDLNDSQYFQVEGFNLEPFSCTRQDSLASVMTAKREAWLTLSWFNSWLEHEQI